ncbi:hypothetical protein QYE76_019305 [Lolium multiflorum]|uniref:Uncharacterized protein n=1 Tax=Lolium multiflorum TaxID=4521 RepID=A0AAD8VR52_LOLMU|nr:hypothetical protein QYE76_019305 [Lolium multiflorum]
MSRACQGWHGRRPRVRQSTRRPIDSHLPWTPSSALSFTTVPGAHQTSTCPRPSPAVAGEETAPRHCRAERCTRPTALGTAQPRHCRQEDRQEPLNSATPSPSSLAHCSHVAAVDLAARAKKDATIARLRAKIVSLEATVKAQEDQLREMEEDGEDIQGGEAFLSDDDDFEEDEYTDVEDYEFLEAREDNFIPIDVDDEE